MKLLSAFMSLLVVAFTVLLQHVSSQQQFVQQQPTGGQQTVQTFQQPQVLLNGGGDGRSLPPPPPGFALVATFAGPFLVPTSNEQRPPLSPPSSASVRPSRQQPPPPSPVILNNDRRPSLATSQHGLFQTASSSNRDNFHPSNQNMAFGSGSNNGRAPVLEFFNPFLSTTQPLFPFHQQTSSTPRQQPFRIGSQDTFHPRFHTNEHLAAVFQTPSSSVPSFNPPTFNQDFRQPTFQQQNFEVQHPSVVPMAGISRPNGQHREVQDERQHFNIDDTVLQLNPNFLNNQGITSAETPPNLSFSPPSNFGMELLTNHQEPPTPTVGDSRETAQPQFFTGFNGQNIFDNQEQHIRDQPSSEQPPVTFREHFSLPSETPQAVDLHLSSEGVPPQQPSSSFPTAPEFSQLPVTLFRQEGVEPQPGVSRPQQSSSSSESSHPQPQDIISFSGEVTTSQEQLPFRQQQHINGNIFHETTATLSTPPHQSISSDTPSIHDTQRPSLFHTFSTGRDQQLPSDTPPTTFSDVRQRPQVSTSARLPIPTESPPPLRPLPTEPSTPIRPPATFSPPKSHTVDTSLDDEQKQLELMQSPGFVAILSGLQRRPLPQSVPRLPSGEDQLQRPHSTTTPLSATTRSTTTTTTTDAITTFKRKPGRARVRVLRPASSRRSSRPTRRPSSSIQTEPSLQELPTRDSHEFPPSPQSSSTLPSHFISDKINVAASSAPPLVGSDAKTCDPNICQLPNCFCGGNKFTPGNLDPSEIPQMVLLTFDDSVNEINYQFYSSLFSKERKNPNGCPILGTFYVSHEWTDYAKIQTLYTQGHEMASHSITHSDGAPFSEDRWLKEIYGQKRILSALGGVSVGDIRGMRAPFLQGGGNKQFSMLHDTNFTYDSSIPSHVNKPPTWPYTLDYRMPHECGIPPCPNKAYPGVWEVPMVMWEDLKGGHCAMADACQNPTDARGVYDMLVKNFKRHYTSNRAPFGMFYHYAWFTHDHHRNGFMAFMDAILQLPDVYLVTNSQMIQWMQNPTPLSRISKFAPWQCKSNTHTGESCLKPKRCSYRFKGEERQFPTCQPCPDKFPWLETYNNLQVIR